jgi:hypothetical protein
VLNQRSNWCNNTSAGALLVEDAVATVTALNDVSRLERVLSSAVCIEIITKLTSELKIRPPLPKARTIEIEILGPIPPSPKLLIDPQTRSPCLCSCFYGGLIR